jgi:hypothetical protein
MVVRDTPDFNFKQTSLVVLLNVDVDGKMGVDISHLVFVSLRHTNDHIVDQCSHSSERSDIFSRSVV